MFKIFLFFTLILLNIWAKDIKMNIYNFTVKDIDNNQVSLTKYKNKVLLIVNTASLCGFTPQYKELQELYDKYKNNNFEILAFPSNQFSNQEPKNNQEIKEFCSVNFQTTFDIFAKIDVNGENQSPLYQYLKDKKSGFLWTKSIKWNFTKFLIDKNGNIINRYAPYTSPLSIENDIKNLI
jgi:glutathione peroxidase